MAYTANSCFRYCSFFSSLIFFSSSSILKTLSSVSSIKIPDLRDAAQLVFYTGYQFFFNFPGTVINFFHGGFFNIFYLEKTKVYPRLQ